MSYRFRIRVSLLPVLAAALAAASLIFPNSGPAGNETGASGERWSEGGGGTVQPAAVATLTDVAGNRVGQVSFEAAPARAGTWIRIAGRNLKPGWQAFAIYDTGECDPNALDDDGTESPFLTAGSTWNPTGASEGARAGDLPMLLVTEDGTAWSRFVTDRFQVDDLFLSGDGGAAIVVEDEQRGVKAACGVVRRAGD